MSLPCPKCGNTLYHEEWNKNPFGVDFVYRCCSRRRPFYYDTIYGWESQRARQERLRVPVACNCGSTFYLAHNDCNYNIERNKPTKCPACVKKTENEACKRVRDRNRETTRKRKKSKKRFLEHFKHGGHNG